MLSSQACEVPQHRQVLDYEQTGTSEPEQAKQFYITNLLIPSKAEIILGYSENKITKGKR